MSRWGTEARVYTTPTSRPGLRPERRDKRDEPGRGTKDAGRREPGSDRTPNRCTRLGATKARPGHDEHVVTARTCNGDRLSKRCDGGGSRRAARTVPPSKRRQAETVGTSRSGPGAGDGVRQAGGAPTGTGALTQVGPKTLTRVMNEPTAVANGETTRTDRGPPRGRGPGAAASERMCSKRAADSESGVDRAEMVVGAT